MTDTNPRVTITITDEDGLETTVSQDYIEIQIDLVIDTFRIILLSLGYSEKHINEYIPRDA